jgi:acyl carrier protein
MIENYAVFSDICKILNRRSMGKMNLDEMKDLVLNYVIKEYMEDEEVEITYDTPLISSGYVDSFSMVSLLVFLENKFKVKIPPSKASPEAFDSVNKIVDLVNQYVV